MDYFNELRLLAVELNKLGLIKFADSIVRTIDYISGDRNTPEDYSYIIELQSNFNDEVINSITNSLSNVRGITEVVAQVANTLKMINDSTGIVDEILANISSDSSNDNARPDRDAILAKEPTEPTKPMPNVKDGFVDLGLDSATMWAEKNIGANSKIIDGVSVEIPGRYFSWGEVYYKSGYGARNYPNRRPSLWVGAGGAITDSNSMTYTNKNGQTLDVTQIGAGTSYTSNSDALKQLFPNVGQNEDDASVAALANNKNLLKSENDAAFIWLGDNCRLPSDDDLDELVNNTTFNTDDNTITLTSNTNSNAIILPVAGLWNGPNQIYNAGPSVVLPEGTTKSTTSDTAFPFLWSGQYFKTNQAKCLALNEHHTACISTGWTATVGMQMRAVYVDEDYKTKLDSYKVKKVNFEHRIGSDWDNFRTLINKFNDKVVAWNEAHPDDQIMQIDDSDYKPIVESPED